LEPLNTDQATWSYDTVADDDDIDDDVDVFVNVQMMPPANAPMGQMLPMSYGMYANYQPQVSLQHSAGFPWTTESPREDHKLKT